jgi:hypothetical protein
VANSRMVTTAMPTNKKLQCPSPTRSSASAFQRKRNCLQNSAVSTRLRLAHLHGLWDRQVAKAFSACIEQTVPSASTPISDIIREKRTLNVEVSALQRQMRSTTTFAPNLEQYLTNNTSKKNSLLIRTEQIAPGTQECTSAHFSARSGRRRTVRLSRDKPVR